MAYFRVSEQAGLTALRSQQTLVDMENTRAEHRLAWSEHRLGVVALILATTIGLATVLQPVDWDWLIPRLAIVIVRVAIVIVGAYLTASSYYGFWWGVVHLLDVAPA